MDVRLKPRAVCGAFRGRCGGFSRSGADFAPAPVHLARFVNNPPNGKSEERRMVWRVQHPTRPSGGIAAQ
ncbi:MAG TPA: hypothetical protein VHG93_27615 [Longimicrobium sp.]|nr:hypothetical protein [Longimicrobium sp.]